MKIADDDALSVNGLVVAHVSDLHLPFEPELSWCQHFSKRQLGVWSWRRRRARHRREILDALRADIAAHGVDHIVITGDLTNFSLPGEFIAAARWLSEWDAAERISIVPGNHDALVPVAAGEGLGRWAAWTGGGCWPYLRRLGGVSLIGLSSALPTAPLLARGRLGAAQLRVLEQLLGEEGTAGRIRVVLLHHPVADGAVSRRKALADRAALRAVLRRAGAELVLHGHAREARLDAIRGKGGPIPCLCVPSSSAVPNPKDQGARWHRLHFRMDGGDRRVAVEVHRWHEESQAFVPDAAYELCLPRATRAESAGGRSGAGESSEHCR